MYCEIKPDVILSAHRPAYPSPSIDGEEWSWLDRARVGDNQGQNPACTMFALANWAEVIHGIKLSDAQIVQAWRQTAARVGRPDGALTYPEAFDGARRAGWLPKAQQIVSASGLAIGRGQPLLAAYAIVPAWDYVSAEGCLLHDPAFAGPISSYHAVLVVNVGRVQSGPVRVVFQNSWGIDWGKNGLGQMSLDLHDMLIRELWAIPIEKGN